jgi:hypothetical protein
MKVAAEFEQVVFGLNEYGLESSLKKMTRPFSLEVERGGIGTAQIVHELTEVGGGSLQEKVVVLCEAP